MPLWRRGFKGGSKKKVWRVLALCERHLSLKLVVPVLKGGARKRGGRAA